MPSGKWWTPVVHTILTTWGPTSGLTTMLMIPALAVVTMLPISTSAPTTSPSMPIPVSTTTALSIPAFTMAPTLLLACLHTGAAPTATVAGAASGVARAVLFNLLPLLLTLLFFIGRLQHGLNHYIKVIGCHHSRSVPGPRGDRGAPVFSAPSGLLEGAKLGCVQSLSSKSPTAAGAAPLPAKWR